MSSGCKYNYGMGLNGFFELNNRAAVAFSGGVDSAYLLSEAVRCGAEVTAYYVKSAFQPEFEREDARRIASQLGAEMRELELDVLSDERVAANPPDRCYYCKIRIMTAITEAARSDGYELLLDGTNASDDAGDRPGMKALREIGVRSPLRECGITKDMVREGARAAGLSVWDKPAYACLATRIPAGELITAEKLAVTEEAESRMAGMGFSDFRVRLRGGGALVQIAAAQHDEAVERAGEIRAALRDLYNGVIIDPEPR